MRTIIYLTLLTFSAFSFKANPYWLEDFNQAQELAKSEEKPILMVFSGSDWCKPCILLDREVFEQDTFQSFAKKELVLLKLDFPRKRKNAISKEIQKQHEKLADQYNPEGAFPLVLLLDHQGQVLKIIQHQSNQVGDFIGQIQQVLNP